MPEAKPKPSTKPAADPTRPVEVKTPLTPPAQVFRVRFSPDGKVLAAGCSDGLVRRWDVSGSEPVELPPLAGHNGWVTGLAFMAIPQKVGGSALFTSDSWGRITAWTAEGKQQWTVEAAHDGWARAVAVSPDKALVATCGRDGFVRQWGAATGERDVEWKVGADVLSVAFAPSGQGLVAGDLFGLVHEYDYAFGKPTRTFEGKEMYRLDRIQDVGGVRCLAFDPAGKTMFCGGAVPKTGGFVQAVPLIVGFDRATGKRVAEWKGASDNEGYVHDLRVDATGTVRAVTSGQPGQGGVLFWKPGEAQPSFTAAKPNCHSLDVSPDGTRLAVSTTNANSSGNGRVKGKDGDSPANFSPIVFWTLPKV